MAVDVRKWPRKNDPESIKARQEALGLDGTVTGIDLEPFTRAQEMLTGAAVIPVSVVGPLELALGEYDLREPDGAVVETGRARETVLVPIAHTEAWLKLIEEAGGTAERDPYLDELAHMTLEADTLEEKVFQMQVFYERLIISRFRLIARASRGTILEDLCNRLTTDDGIHHGAGMAYERVLLHNADKKTKQRLVDAANRLLPIFVKHALWRPKERAFIGRAMHERDVERLKEDVEIGIRLAQSLGLDVSDVQLPA